MKQIIFILTIVLLIISCKSNSQNKKKAKKITVEIIRKKDVIPQRVYKETKVIKEIPPELQVAFTNAIRVFPKDSASLFRFYFEWFRADNKEKVEKQIKRLEKLTSEESVKRYNDVENTLKPLLKNVVLSNTITKKQSDSLVTLYSDYDYFTGESLFSQLLTNDENYSLVWESLKLMIKESSKDTCYISGLIKLYKNVRTNVELAEALEDYKVKAIINNPLGFLEMYNCRRGKQRERFAYYITVWDDPTKEVMELLTEISQNSNDEKYRKLATELIDKFKVE